MNIKDNKLPCVDCPNHSKISNFAKLQEDNQKFTKIVFIIRLILN